ncbi:multidrug efflux SMR transporter [Candidatus Sumerlaeota bacterium]|nr:multidrug efflux SMR transporter [Candidatus Sumerlaeota bacterium]MBI3735843.1 multidrug efflux SMR transporter [Candidatus Sumerlaeota bacterium]
MHWILLFLAIILEVCGTTCMKLSEGMTKTMPTILMGVFYVACFSVFAIALKKIDVGVAYAIWAGLGTMLIALIGIFYFGEAGGMFKIGSIALIILGVIGLHLSGAGH